VVVSAHLLGGMVLLGLLMAQLESLRQAPRLTAARGAGVVLLLLAAQIALGGWVSSNYAVLACRGFPQCNGQWWPSADFAAGFTLLRELGRAGPEGYVSFDALVAIQMAHRLFAVVVSMAVVVLALRLWREASDPSRRAALLLGSLLLLQLLSGLSNVLLDWPLLAALAHTSGAAALVALLVSLMWRARAQAEPSRDAIDTPWRQRHA
jgi:heme a synthase